VGAEGERGVQNRRCESGGAAAKHQSVVGGLFQGHIHKAENEKKGSGNMERSSEMAGMHFFIPRRMTLTITSATVPPANQVPY
jgi:hypothetical protein